MRAVFVLVFSGMVVALAAQAVPPPQTPPPVGVPTAQVPQVTPRMVPTPQAPVVPTAQVPQTTVPSSQIPPSAAPMGQVTQQAPAGQVFEGRWSGSGQRQRLPTEAGVSAVTVQLSGAVTITTGTGLSRGFRGEVIGFDDGAGLIAGRVVWTDERGDRIFSVLRGDALAAAGRQMHGTFTGGTGRYAGVAGEYEFQWQYVISAEDSPINGRAISLRGWVRPGSGR